MLCLGIESTAHTFGIAVVSDKKKVLANVRSLFTTESGGMIPAEVADHHVKICNEILNQALTEAKIKLKDIDLIAFSQSPGIGHTLRIGAFFARSLAVLLNKPLVGVNHCIAHLEVGSLATKSKDPVLLYASGANTQIIAYDGGKFRIFGETLDIGVGNFLDSFARHVGLGFPGGPKIYELALKGATFIELPYTVKGMDVSFGGLLTNLKQKYDSGNYKLEDLCYSLQETIFAMLLEVSERALAHCNKKELLLGGGVACNKRFQEMAKTMCKDFGAKCFIPENQLLIDNAAMIAWNGILMNKSGVETKIENSHIDPYERTDDVDVVWRK
ncbi:bifunctional N(6)-L-threonylcarbamoyladenine synthase/serine/threonine protein kinase [Candidatus Woesearchaeota archaeon]|nr:bifunctional N(6)-L-threonylcarbamoyladenine synthase/serine/threonine protein kinase [Candidatus Woesearchaeota archaeon]